MAHFGPTLAIRAKSIDFRKADTQLRRTSVPAPARVSRVEYLLGSTKEPR